MKKDGALQRARLAIPNYECLVAASVVYERNSALARRFCAFALKVNWLGFGWANRDPGVFPEPDRVVLDRVPSRHLAFGVRSRRNALRTHGVWTTVFAAKIKPDR